MTRLFEMLPRPSLVDRGDVLDADAVLASDGARWFAGTIPPAYIPDSILSQSRTTVALTSRVAAFGLPVGDVVQLSAEKQMIGVHTGGVIAPMTDNLVLGYWPEVELVGDAVSEDAPVFIADAPVTEAVCRLAPIPAGVGLRNEGPEPIRESVFEKTQAGLVPAKEVKRFSTLQTKLLVVMLGRRGGLAAAALTKPEGLQVKGKLSILTHVTDLLSRLVANPRTFTASRGFVVPNYSTIELHRQFSLIVRNTERSGVT